MLSTELIDGRALLTTLATVDVAVDAIGPHSPRIPFATRQSIATRNIAREVTRDLFACICEVIKQLIKFQLS